QGWPLALVASFGAEPRCHIRDRPDRRAGFGVIGPGKDGVEAGAQRSLELGAVIATRVRDRNFAEDGGLDASDRPALQQARSSRFGAELARASGGRLRAPGAGYK